jgi:hypothetical protein
MIDPLITKAADMAARVAENEIRAQAPSENIASGVKVVPSVSGNGGELDITFTTVLDSDVKYGWYLDTGTLKEKRVNDEAEWDPNPGEGEGGIKPRHWTNLPEQAQERIDMLIEEAFVAAQEQRLEQLMSKL